MANLYGVLSHLGHLLRVAVPAADLIRVHGPEEQGEQGL